jgi:hypothetical protein
MELPFRNRRRQVVPFLRQSRAGNDRRSRRARARSEQTPTRGRRAPSSRRSDCAGGGSFGFGLRGIIFVLLAVYAGDWRVTPAIVAKIVWSDKTADAHSSSLVARTKPSALMLSSFGE